jgi:hypothetical protein
MLQVRSASLHPSMPWIVAGDAQGYVSVHNYQTGHVLLHVPIDGKHHVDKSVDVRHVTFFDDEVSWWREKEEFPHDSSHASHTPPTCLRSQGWPWTSVIAITEVAVWLIDCASGQVTDLFGFDGKLVTSMCVLPVSGIGSAVALACTDGHVRIIDPRQRTCNQHVTNKKMVRVFSYGKSKALNKLAVYTTRETYSESTAATTPASSSTDKQSAISLTASSENHMYTWRWRDSDHNTPPKVTQTDSDIIDMCYMPAVKQLATICGDKGITVWHTTPSLNEAFRIRPAPKHLPAYTCAAPLLLPLPVGLCFAVWGAKEHARLTIVTATAQTGSTRVAHTCGALEDIPAQCGINDKKAAAKFKVYGMT